MTQPKVQKGKSKQRNEAKDCETYAPSGYLSEKALQNNFDRHLTIRIAFFSNIYLFVSKRFTKFFNCVSEKQFFAITAVCSECKFLSIYALNGKVYTSFESLDAVDQGRAHTFSKTFSKTLLIYYKTTLLIENLNIIKNYIFTAP